jgi:mRNA-degrading endonuclease toxin of MazEF toxin-antitoxin module
MPSLRTLFRTPRAAAETIAPDTAGETLQETSKVQVFRVEAADELYLRNPHGMLRMDPATAEAYAAAMAG